MNIKLENPFKIIFSSLTIGIIKPIATSCHKKVDRIHCENHIMNQRFTFNI